MTEPVRFQLSISIERAAKMELNYDGPGPGLIESMRFWFGQEYVDAEYGMIYWQPTDDQVLLWDMCHHPPLLRQIFNLTYEGLD